MKGNWQRLAATVRAKDDDWLSEHCYFADNDEWMENSQNQDILFGQTKQETGSDGERGNDDDGGGGHS